MTNTTSLINTSKPHVLIDRLSICFSEHNADDVKGTCDLLISDKCQGGIPGIKLTSNARYKVRATIPVPFMSNAVNRHPIFFEAGPFHPGLPSYRLDFNPSKLPANGMDELFVLLDSLTHATASEFFGLGRVTRVDVAVDLPGYTLDDVIVLTKRKQKHGVYSDRYGFPETVYLGTPRSARVVAYTKVDKSSGNIGTRLECRLKPKCFGHQVAELANPLAKVELLSVDALQGLSLGFPHQVLADSIRVRGLKRALAVFDAPQRKLIIETLTASKSLLPDATELWAKWPEALIDVGLGKELGAIPGPWAKAA
jgi:hypothetical protein